jgi:hypothetical protein
MFQICSGWGFLWPQVLWSVDGGQVVPNLIGKKIYCLLTYYIVVVQAAGNRDESDLGDCLWYPCVMDVLGSLAQPRGLPYWGCFGSGRGRAPWRRSCDWGNGSRDIVACEPAMYPFFQLQRPLFCGIGCIHDRRGVGHSTEVLNQDHLVGGDHPLFTARDHPLLVPCWCHCLGHLLEVVLWQDPCMAWAHEEGGPARTYCLV